MVMEPAMMDKPHSSTAEWQAVALALAKYFQVFLLLPKFEYGAKELYSTEIKIDNNFTGLSLIIRKSKLSFMSLIRLKKAFYAASKIFEETSKKADYLIFIGLESLIFNLKDKRSTAALKLLIAPDTFNDFSAPFVSKGIQQIDMFYFLSEDIQAQFKEYNAHPSDRQILSHPINEGLFEEKPLEKNTVLMIVEFEDSNSIKAIIEMVNQAMAKKPELRFCFSAKHKVVKLLKSKLNFQVNYLTHSSEFTESIAMVEKIVIASNYSDGFPILARVLAVKKPILFLTNRIALSFPFREYCYAVEETQWVNNPDMLTEFTNQNIVVKDDLEELIADNHAPEVMAFAIKHGIEKHINKAENE